MQTISWNDFKKMEFPSMFVNALRAAFYIRKSCRSFDSERKILPDGALDVIIKSPSDAPYASGGPRYTTSLLKGTPALREACVGQKYAEECSDAIVFFGTDTDTHLRSGHPKYIFDATIAATYMDLTATVFGLGTCWIGNFYPDKIQKLCGIKLKPVIILLVGYKK